MFFCLPIRIEQNHNSHTIPLVNPLLIGINLLVFAFFGSSVRQSHDTIMFDIVSYSFVHVSLWHLLANMWVLWVFGNKLNQRLGNLWYALVYLGTAIVMGIALRLLLGINIVGASGAVFAVIAVCLIVMPASLVDILCIAVFPLTLLLGLFARPKHWMYWLIRWGQFKVKALWLLFLVPVLEIWAVLLWGWNWTSLGHLLGLACGVAAVLMLPKRISMRYNVRAYTTV